MALDRNSTISRVISLLRFPLIVGVVVIHSTFRVNEEGYEARTPWYDALSTVLSDVLPLVAVPMFFIFAGYLFFFGVDSFGSGIYLRRLRSRFRSLLVPYLFWTLLYCVVILLAENVPALHDVSNSFKRPDGFGITSLWAARDSYDSLICFPIAMQFWFIRDLMVCVVLSPLYWFLITRYRGVAVAVLGALWIAGWQIPWLGARGFSSAAIFFFALGGWLAYRRSDVVSLARDMRFFGYLWPALVALLSVAYLQDWEHTTLLRNCCILSGEIFVLCFSARLVEKHNCKPVALLSASTFFVFSFHVPYAFGVCRKALMWLIGPMSDGGFCVVYLFSALLTVLLSIGVYWIVARLTPSFARFVSGGR